MYGPKRSVPNRCVVAMTLPELSGPRAGSIGSQAGTRCAPRAFCRRSESRYTPGRVRILLLAARVCRPPGPLLHPAPRTVLTLVPRPVPARASAPAVRGVHRCEATWIAPCAARGRERAPPFHDPCQALDTVRAGASVFVCARACSTRSSARVQLGIRADNHSMVHGVAHVCAGAAWVCSVQNAGEISKIESSKNKQASAKGSARRA